MLITTEFLLLGTLNIVKTEHKHTYKLYIRYY
jgi:hypothetical protein